MFSKIVARFVNGRRTADVRPAGRTPARIEAVEPRRLMAADPSIVLEEDRDVTVTGTDGADVIVAERVGFNDLRITVNNLTRTFDSEEIVGLRLNGLAGDDRITTIGDVRYTNHVFIRGDEGVDTITTNNSGAYLFGGEIFRANNRTVATRQADGSLRVLGTSGADTISVFGVQENDGERVEIGSYFLGYFGENQFSYYQVDGGAGDDHLSVPDLILTSVRLNGQDGNDVLDATGGYPSVTARGGNGNDTLRGGRGDDLLYGEAGNDVIRANDGNDRLDGGDGDDLLDGGDGGDEFIGGLGIDLADYSNRIFNEHLTIGIGSYADDGVAGEGDNVRTGVENVTGGAGNDTITGDGVRNVLRGGEGSDTLRGLGGNDFFNPGAGADRVYGGDGNDEIYARDGIRDLVLDGGSGYDKAQRDSTDPRTSIEQTIA